MISVSRSIYEIALNLTMIESDPVQTAHIPYPPPSHASLTLAPLRPTPSYKSEMHSHTRPWLANISPARPPIGAH